MPEKQEYWGMDALSQRQEELRKHNNSNAKKRDEYISSQKYFYQQIERLLRFIVEPGKRVLHLGCQTGHRLEIMEPSSALGMDYSDAYLEIAKKKHPEYELHRQELTEIPDSEPFDCVLVSNLGKSLDILDQFHEIKKVTTRDTLVVVYNYNHLWEPLSYLGEKLGIKYPEPNQNWISEKSTKLLLELGGYDVIRNQGLS